MSPIFTGKYVPVAHRDQIAQECIFSLAHSRRTLGEGRLARLYSRTFAATISLQVTPTIEMSARRRARALERESKR